MSYLGTNRGRARLSLEPVSGTSGDYLTTIPNILAWWAMREKQRFVFDETENGYNAITYGTPTFSAANGVRKIGVAFNGSQYMQSFATISGNAARSLVT